ncbi:MAG TPA: hypothetical protein VG500_08540 [Gemmatimonadales bacterium]|nr:hypothetical protein [Gemmatimonadales bacterium]
MQARLTLLAALLLAPAIADAQTGVRRGTPYVYDPNAPRTLEALPPPPPGPPPQGIRFDAQATYGIFAKLAWNPAPNAVGYEVSRGKRDNATCCNATSGRLPAGATSWADVGLFQAGYYSYTLTVYYADGSAGKGGVDLLNQKGASPAPVTVQELSPGRVRLEWDRGVPGTCCVKIIGPGFGAAGEKMVVGGGPVDLILPPGTHSWKVAAAYNAANLPVQPATHYGTAMMYGDTYVVLAPPSEWADVSHTVNIRGGRYRISLERFHADVDVREDLFRADGRGNEIYIATQVSEYRPGGQLFSTRMVRTPTFGDRHNFPNRVQAGSASPSGGIQAKDEYPAAVEYVSQLRPPTTTNLPYVLWEGDLNEVEGLVILSPAIWEADEDDRLFGQVATFHTGAARNWPSRSYLQAYVPRAGGGSVLDTWRATIGNDCNYSDRFQPQGSWGDEPIDLTRSYPWCPTYVAINYAVARSLTSVNPATVVDIPFFTSSSEPIGRFKLYIRVEKVEPTATVAPVQVRRRAAGP